MENLKKDLRLWTHKGHNFFVYWERHDRGDAKRCMRIIGGWMTGKELTAYANIDSQL